LRALTRSSVLLAVTLALSSPAAAEIAVLRNGSTFKVDGFRLAGGRVTLALRDGGEVEVPAWFLDGLLPDEIAEADVPGETPRSLREVAAEAARRHGVDPELVLAVVDVESAFRTDAVSPKGALGLMQLMPATAAALGVTDPFDPAQNLDAGARHLRALLLAHDGDLEKALAAYNAGSEAVRRHGGVPPYPETRDYVRKVLGRYQEEER
jgi:soluble lytic murein transglycosylase-like protein